tara:strand:- start:8870 stop:9607 length:738 start_codon:yes stop_codon:yes gene_type:complete
MGIITLDLSARDNLPPSASGWKSISVAFGATHVFTLANFTTETTPAFADPEGDALEAIKITTLPSQGTLKKGVTDVILNEEITSAELTAGDLTYVSDGTDTDGYSDGFMEFLVSDDGSSTFTTTPKTVTLIMAGNVNQAPTSVGDGELDVTVGSTTIFTRAMLTSLLNPSYSDPEGDAALNLLVETVPVYGNMYLSGVLVVDDQVVSFADIDAGNLTYINIGLATISDEEFSFRISDAGSGEYIG